MRALILVALLGATGQFAFAQDQVSIGRTLTLDEIEELADSGPGRPVSTGSAATPLVQFRVGTAERADLERRAKALGETVGEYARRKTLARD